MISRCPQCSEQVAIPDGVIAEAIVRCPFCSAEYPLADALASVPPTLIVVSLGPGLEGMRPDELAARHASGEGATAVAPWPAAMPAVDAAEGDVDAWLTPGAASDTDEGLELGESGDDRASEGLEMAADDADAPEAEEDIFSFAGREDTAEQDTEEIKIRGEDDAPAPDDGVSEAEPPVFMSAVRPRGEEGEKTAAAKMRRKRGKEKNPVKEMIGVVLGGFLGLFIAYYGLNFFGGSRFEIVPLWLPGCPHTEQYRPTWLGGAAKASNQQPADENRAPVVKKPAANTGNRAARDANTLTTSDALQGDSSDTGSELGTFGDPPAPDMSDIAPPAIEPAGVDVPPMADLPGLGPLPSDTEPGAAAGTEPGFPGLDSPPAVTPMDEPGVAAPMTDAPTDDAPADDIPAPADDIPAPPADMPAPPTDNPTTPGVPGLGTTPSPDALSPAPLTPEPPSLDMPAMDVPAVEPKMDEPPTDEPPIDEPVVEPVGVGPRNLPEYTAADVDAALAEVYAAFGCPECKSTGTVTKDGEAVACKACEGAPKFEMTPAIYAKFAKLAEVVTYAKSNADMAERKAEVEAIVGRVAAAGLADEVGRLAAEQLKSAEGPKGGLLIASTIGKEFSKDGLFGVTVETLGEAHRVGVFKNETFGRTAGERILLLGAVLNEPAKNLAGAQVAKPWIIWTGMTVRTAAE